MKHDFLEMSIKAMIDDLTKKLEPFSSEIETKFPIMIMNSGDEVYLSNINDKSSTNLHDRVPRMVLDVNGFTVNVDQLTNPYIMSKFNDDNAGFVSPKRSMVKRIPIEFPITAQVYFSNVFEFFKFTEILLMVTYRNNVFDYYYAGKYLKASYNYQDDFTPDVNKTLAYDNDRRQRVLPLNFSLELQFPAYDYYNSNSILDESTKIQTGLHRTHTEDDFDADTAEKVYVPQVNS